MSGRIVFVALTARGADLARRLAAELPDAEVHGLAKRVDGADETFQDTAAHLRDLFAAGRPIVAVCAAGIAVRALAPLLADKRTEPPVVALSEDGRAVVSLLGGHRGGDALARRMGDLLDIEPAITAAATAVSESPSMIRPPAGAWPIRTTTKASLHACWPGPRCVSRVRRLGLPSLRCLSPTMRH